MNSKYGAGGGGVTVPHQRMEATCRVAAGGPAERATYPSAPDAGICWSARQRGSRGLAEDPSWQADRQQVPGQQDRSAAQTGRTHSCSVLRNGESVLKDLTVLAPPLLVGAAFVIAVGAFLRHEMGASRRHRDQDASDDISGDGTIPDTARSQASAQSDDEDATGAD